MSRPVSSHPVTPAAIAADTVRGAAIPAHIHVCGLAHVPRLVDETGARHLVTIIGGYAMPETPSSIAAANHLKLSVHDIVDHEEGRIVPGEAHIRQLLAFIERWERTAPMLIHCWAGISRSTAGAFIALCALNPRTPERSIATRLRMASPTADPNRRMLRHADALLGRDGRMLAAVEAMSARNCAIAGQPFSLPSQIG